MKKKKTLIIVVLTTFLIFYLIYRLILFLEYWNPTLAGARGSSLNIEEARNYGVLVSVYKPINSIIHVTSNNTIEIDEIWSEYQWSFTNDKRKVRIDTNYKNRVNIIIKVKNEINQSRDWIIGNFSVVRTKEYNTMLYLTDKIENDTLIYSVDSIYWASPNDKYMAHDSIGRLVIYKVE